MPSGKSGEMMMKNRKDHKIGRPEDPAFKLIGDQLRQLRQKRGLTQSEMQDLGISHKYYQRIEAGKANVTIRTLAGIIKALNFEFSKVFRLVDGPKYKLKINEKRVGTGDIIIERRRKHHNGEHYRRSERKRREGKSRGFTEPHAWKP
jgi:transcriptional regulator with XRE-family HTH domain